MLAAETMRSHAKEKVELELDIAPVQFNLDSAIPCGLIIHELLSNALKHAFPDQREGLIRIQLKSDDEDTFVLVVNDNGIGLPKDMDLKNTSSLGFQLVVTLTNQLRGEVTVERNGGTSIVVSFPKT